MGIRFRKSINIGGFRVNASKSGLGYSFGVPGYRVTKTAKGSIRRTISIPGTGLSHVTEHGNRKHVVPTKPNNPKQNIESTNTFEGLMILIRILSMIFILAGTFLLFTNLVTGIVVMGCGILTWNIAGKSLHKNNCSNLGIIELNRELEILNDSARIIEKTVRPEVFFSRYNLYMEKLSLLANAEARKKVSVSGDSFVKKYNVMKTEQKKIEAFNDFIDRAWSYTVDNANKLKTTAGKENRYKKFYDSFEAFESQMPTQCKQYYKTCRHKKN